MKTRFFLIATAFLLPAAVANAEIPTCIREGLVLENLHVTEVDAERISYSGVVKYNGPAVIGGLYYGGAIFHVAREVPLGELRVDLRKIPGGLASGERLEVDGWTYLGARGAGMIKNFSQVRLSPDLIAVADSQFRPFDPVGPSIGGWADTSAANPCEH
ncbi:hypothetical protein [Actibacterium sp. D379-3]